MRSTEGLAHNLLTLKLKFIYNFKKPFIMQYLTIKQVSEITGIPSYTLRFWEKEFDGILVPSRTDGGQRRFCGEDISIIENIKRLKEQGMSLTGIKARLTDEHSECDSDENRIDLLAKRVAEVVKGEVYRFLSGEEM